MLMDIQIPMETPSSDQVKLIQRAEEMGFDGAGLADHMENGHDVFTTLAAAAVSTKRISLYPCVSNPITRHPWVLANIAYTMNELAPGRFSLIIGAGDSVPLNIGKKPAKVAETREAVTQIQSLLRGEAVNFGSAVDKSISGAKPPAPPVAIAAGARRMTELAGEIGDAGFLLTGFDERILGMVRRHLQEGAARAGRSLGGFPLTHYTLIRIENDPEAAAEFGRSRMLGWLKMSFFRNGLAELGLPESQLENPDQISPADMDRLWEALFIVGPIERIAERIEQIAQSKTLDRMVCVPSGLDGWDGAAKALVEKVLPRVK